MFFFLAVTSGKKELGLRRCGYFPCCGIRGAPAPVVCTFERFILFFLPLFRFGKRYFVSCPDCGAVYEIDPREGRRIEQDPYASIDPSRIRLVSKGNRTRYCTKCGAPVSPGDRFCPKCGAKLD